MLSLVISLQSPFSQKGAFTHVPFLPPFFIFPTLIYFSLAVGIIGATVMPHSLFLGSTLATQDRVEFSRSLKNHQNENDDENENDNDDDRRRRRRFSSISLGRFLSACKESVLSAFRKPPPNLYANAATRYSEHANNSYEFVRAHIYHGTVDMIGSLLGFAVVINSLFVAFSFKKLFFF